MRELLNISYHQNKAPCHQPDMDVVVPRFQICPDFIKVPFQRILTELQEYQVRDYRRGAVAPCSVHLDGCNDVP